MMHGAILARPVLERLTLSILQLILNHRSPLTCYLDSVSPACNTLADPSADKYLDPCKLRTLELVSGALLTVFYKGKMLRAAPFVEAEALCESLAPAAAVRDHLGCILSRCTWIAAASMTRAHDIELPRRSRSLDDKL